VKFDEGALRKDLNAIKKEQFPWMYEVTKCAPQLAIKNGLNSAFKRFFKGTSGFPKFHKKGEKDSFQLDNEQFSVSENHIKIALLDEPVRMAEPLRFTGKILSATVSRKADHWYVSVQVEADAPEPLHTTMSENQAIGVDVGVATLAVLSCGTEIVGNKPSRKYAKKLRRQQQSLSRKQGSRKGETKSKNYRKQQVKVSRLHEKAANSRNDGLHKLTTMLTQTYSLIGIEDLNIKGMVKNHNLARSILDQSWHELGRQLRYKAETTGSRVHYSDRFFASSQLCSECGYKNAEVKSLSVRQWICPNCGVLRDRDINAAQNLKQDAIRAVVSGT
jgi:putative transposase